MFRININKIPATLQNGIITKAARVDKAVLSFLEFELGTHTKLTSLNFA